MKKNRWCEVKIIGNTAKVLRSETEKEHNLARFATKFGSRNSFNRWLYTHETELYLTASGQGVIIYVFDKIIE